jgi:hypothetical protein
MFRNLNAELLAFKAEWQLYVPAALTISKSSFCIYGFSIILSVNSDNFSFN